MAFTAVTALITGSQAVSAALILTAVTQVGVALTVVGAVTGSKSLMKIGAVMSLVGGVGGFINGAVGAAAGAGAETLASASGLSKAAGASYEAGAGIMDGFGAAAEGTMATSGVTELAPTLGTDIAQSTPGIVNPAASTPAPNTGGIVAPSPAATANDIAGVNAPMGATGPAVTSAPPTPFEADYVGSAALSGNTAPANSGSFFSRFSQFAEKNKTLMNSGMQLVGGAMKGANEGAMWDEKMALEKQRLKQTGYGNTVASFQPRGIVGGARA